MKHAESRAKRTGKRQGRIVFVEWTRNGWRCKCDCGREVFIKNNASNYRSCGCSGKGRRQSREIVEAKFWSAIDMRSEGECWNWKGSLTEWGYGLIKKFGYGPSNRLAYFLSKGPIPPGLCVRHTCDNPVCCNPQHLILGTNQENTADRVARNRSARGERHGSARLTESQVIEIRRLYAEGHGSPMLARMFGVGKSQINRILTGEKWGHVTGVIPKDQIRNWFKPIPADIKKQISVEPRFQSAVVAAKYGVSQSSVLSIWRSHGREQA